MCYILSIIHNQDFSLFNSSWKHSFIIQHESCNDGVSRFVTGSPLNKEIVLPTTVNDSCEMKVHGFSREKVSMKSSCWTYPALLRSGCALALLSAVLPAFRTGVSGSTTALPSTILRWDRLTAVLVSAGVDSDCPNPTCWWRGDEVWSWV